MIYATQTVKIWWGFSPWWWSQG